MSISNYVNTQNTCTHTQKHQQCIAHTAQSLDTCIYLYLKLAKVKRVIHIHTHFRWSLLHKMRQESDSHTLQQSVENHSASSNIGLRNEQYICTRAQQSNAWSVRTPTKQDHLPLKRRQTLIGMDM